MAKGETTVQTTPTPAVSPGAATREAVEAEIALLPQRYETELAYRPKFTQVDIEAMKQYAPEVFGLQEQFARQERALGEELYPEMYGAEKKLGGIVGGDVSGEFSPEEQQYYLDTFRSEEAAAGRLGSPTASLNISNKLAMLKEQRRAQRMGELMSYAGRTPVVGSQQFQPQTTAGQPTQTGALTSSILGYAAGTYKPATTQTTSSPFDWASVLSGGLSGGGAVAGGMIAV